MIIGLGTGEKAVCSLCNLPIKGILESDLKRKLREHLSIYHGRMMVTIKERKDGNWEMHGIRWKHDMDREGR
jgi:hypothetical protein